LLSDVPDPLLNFSQVLRTGRQVEQSSFKILEKVVSERWQASRFVNAWRGMVHQTYPVWNTYACWLGETRQWIRSWGHFGSLKELERASFQELRQFLTRREAETVIAGLSMWSVVDTEEALSGPTG
jgi:hypothetical protein